MNAPLKQQSPLEGVGNGANDSIIEASENQTAQPLSMNSLNDAMKASLCLYDSHSAKIGKVMTYENLLHCVNNPPKGQVTDPTQVKAKKQTLPLVTPFISTDLAKTKEAALTARYWALVLDFDKEQQRTLSGIAGILKETYQAGEFCGFTTSSHTVGGLNAFKFVIPLADAVGAHTYTALAEGLCLLLDTDPAQARTQQGFYSPCDMLSPSVYEKHINNGERLSPSTALWKKAVERYLQNIEEQAHKAPIKPHQQYGGTDIFNLINQHYSLEDLLQQAGHTQQGGKWLSPHSSSGIAGGMIFDTANGKRFYSHSSSCPLGKDAHNGHSLDVADILAATKYGGSYSEMVKQEAPIVDAEGQKQRQASHTTAQDKAAVQAEQALDELHRMSTGGDIVIPPYILNTVIGKLAQRVAHCLEMPLASVFVIMLAGASAACATNYRTRFNSGSPVALGIYAVAEQPPSTSKNLVLSYAMNAYQSALGGHNAEIYKENEDGAKKPYSFVVESDATSAAMDKQLANCQSGRFVIASAEQEAFSTLFPSESVSYLSSIGLVLNGWGGEYYSSLRSGRQSYSGDVWGTVITFAQNGSIAKVLNASSGRGLSERFLLVAEESMLGKRTLDRGYVSKADKVDFETSVQSCISRYLAKKHEHIRIGKLDLLDVITPTSTGYELIQNKRREIEPLLGELHAKGENVYLGWLGKLETHVLKIASVIHIFGQEHQTPIDSPIAATIPDQLIEQVITLVLSLGEHVRHVIQENGQSGEKAEVEAIIDILSEKKLKKTPLTQKAKRRKPFKTHDDRASYHRAKRSIEKMIEQKIIITNDRGELEIA